MSETSNYQYRTRGVTGMLCDGVIFFLRVSSKEIFLKGTLDQGGHGEAYMDIIRQMGYFICGSFNHIWALSASPSV